MSQIVFFHRDMFQSERLIPGESKRILIPLARKMDLHLLGIKGPHVPPALKNQSTEYVGHAGLFASLRHLQRTGCTLVVIESPFTADGILCTIFCTVLGLGIVFQPFSQFSRHVMGRRLFGTNPDVKVLEKDGSNGAVRGQTKSILLKKLTIALMRTCFRLRGRGWLTLSKFEESEIRTLFQSVRERPFLRVPWALSDDPLKTGIPDYFAGFPEAAGKLKIVLWSRLDYELKGIDRLLAGVAADHEGTSDYQVFLIGPDYAGGLAKVQSRLKELGIEDRVTIIGPDRYTSGDHSPLAMADASVLLSRWDGFPRALRESIQLDVPVLISPETHFSDLVAAFPCGECASDPDDPASVRAALHRLIQGIRAGRYDRASFELARNSLSAESLAATMEVQFCERL